MNLNSSPSQQIVHDHNDDHHDLQHHYFGPLNPSSCRIFFGSTTQDHMGYYDDHHQTVDNYDYNYGRSTYEIKNKDHESGGLKLTLWKKEDDNNDDRYDDHEKSNNNYPVKWMCSKMRVMQKMKKPDDEDRTALNESKIKDDLQKNMQPSLSSMESSDHLISTNNCSHYSNNNSSPIRVCADCNTTKTPLWRSGPKGPKSLCNACGIRQRKARRAMAAAANGVVSDHLPTPAKIKLQLCKEKKIGKKGHAHANSQLKIKRCKTTPVADSACGNNNIGEKKIGNNLEDFLINLSKNLSFHRVFPEDEKDAAILLMALSSGLVHG